MMPTGAPLDKASYTMLTLSCVTHTSVALARFSDTQSGPVSSTGTTRIFGQAVETSCTKSAGVRREVVSTMGVEVSRAMEESWFSTSSASQL